MTLEVFLYFQTEYMPTILLVLELDITQIIIYLINNFLNTALLSLILGEYFLVGCKLIV